MKIVVPFAEDGLSDETRELGESLNAQFVLTPRADPTAYFALMSRWWSEGEQFIVLEQDVVPSLELLEGMWDCPDDEWCHGYWVDPADANQIPHSQWLGCARFSESLLQRAPDMMAKVGKDWGRHWNQQDIGLWHQLKALRDGRGPHLHSPAVTHLHQAMEQRRAAAELNALKRDGVVGAASLADRERLGLTF